MLPERVSVRKLDLLASLLAGLDPDAADPPAAVLRFAGPARAEPETAGAPLDCGDAGGGICTIAALGTDEPGAYWITAGRDRRVARALVVRADASVWTRDDGAKLVVWGVSEGGRPLAGATVRALRGRKIVATATLSPEGLAVLALPPAPAPLPAAAGAADGAAAARAARTWVHVRTADGEELLFAHARAPAASPPLLAEILTDRPMYAAGDEVRAFAVVSGVPAGVHEVTFRWTGPGGETGSVGAPLSAAGAASARFMPDVGEGLLTLAVVAGGRSAETVVPVAADGAGAAGPGPLLAPLAIAPGEAVRAIGPRWTKGLESAGGGEARIRAVPLPTMSRATVARSMLFDPGDVAGRALERTIDVRFHGDIRYELPYDALSAFGSPSVVYVSIAEKAAAGADRAPAKDVAPGGKGVLWSFTLLANGTAEPPPVPADEPAADDWIALAPSYVRDGAALPLRAHLKAALAGVAILEDAGILGAAPFGVAGARTPALALPATGSERPHVVARIGRGPMRVLPVLAARHFLGIDLRADPGGAGLALELYDEDGRPVTGEAAVLVQHEDVLAPLARWTPPAARLFGGEGCAAADGDRVWERYFPAPPTKPWHPAATGGTRVTARPEVGAPPPLAWEASVAVPGAAVVAWRPPVEAGLLRVTVLAAAAGRVGKRVFFLASEAAEHSR